MEKHFGPKFQSRVSDSGVISRTWTVIDMSFGEGHMHATNATLHALHATNTTLHTSHATNGTSYLLHLLHLSHLLHCCLYTSKMTEMYKPEPSNFFHTHHYSSYNTSPPPCMIIVTSVAPNNIPRMATTLPATSIALLNASNLVTIRTGGLSVKEDWINKRLK